ncbi:MAG: AMP-binding protein, partial [Deltaproteobacteria bacterium]|nr:AMP-binding protein [Deltaproteobacteria bacterium]
MALVDGARRFTWAEVDREVVRAHRALLAAGTGAGDRVAVLARNRAEFAWTAFAAARARAVLVPLNARLTAQELGPLVSRVTPAVVLAERALVDRLPGAAALEPFSAPALVTAEPAPTVDDAPDRAWLFTSGTTGVSKAAALTGANFTASARASALNLGGGEDSCWLACLPLFHVGGLALLWRVAEGGGRAVLQDGFQAERVLSALEAEQVTHLSVVPTGLRRLLQLG